MTREELIEKSEEKKKMQKQYVYFIIYKIVNKDTTQETNTFLTLNKKILSNATLIDVQNYLKTFYPDCIGILVTNFSLEEIYEIEISEGENTDG